jgi:hypothetical protein
MAERLHKSLANATFQLDGPGHGQFHQPVLPDSAGSVMGFTFTLSPPRENQGDDNPPARTLQNHSCHSQPIWNAEMLLKKASSHPEWKFKNMC